jgi:hypothetical protein
MALDDARATYNVRLAAAEEMESAPSKEQAARAEADRTYEESTTLYMAHAPKVKQKLGMKLTANEQKARNSQVSYELFGEGPDEDDASEARKPGSTSEGKKASEAEKNGSKGKRKEPSEEGEIVSTDEENNAFKIKKTTAKSEENTKHEFFGTVKDINPTLGAMIKGWATEYDKPDGTHRKERLEKQVMDILDWIGKPRKSIIAGHPGPESLAGPSRQPVQGRDVSAHCKIPRTLLFRYLRTS